jgi:DNA-binding response OmpR family regulator
VPRASVQIILVVEDDLLLRVFYRTVLKNAGYQVVAVEDGLDALAWVEQQTPGAIVLDLSLVRVSGRDVQRELRARAETRQIPIIVVTGADDIGDLNEAELACVLHKPVTGEALVDAVSRCLHRRGER